MFEPQFESSEVAQLLSPSRQVLRMLAFEAALARGQGELGMIPTAAAQTIVAVCNDPVFHRGVVLDDAKVAGNPAIPFVRQLTAGVRAKSGGAADWVHYGATSQDVLDTATMLALREVYALVTRDLVRARARLVLLAERHADTPIVGRTLLQHAVPVTFGYKAVQWLAALDEAATSIARVDRTLPMQLGGPVGTLAQFGEQARVLAERVAAHLGLSCPALSWHTNRTRLAECAATLAVLSGALGKIGRDITLLMQTEVAEAIEGAAAGKGGSSSMPHKRNPVDALAAIVAADVTPHLAGGLLATMVQEHERATGAWHAEWVLLPKLCSLTHRAVQAVAELLEHLELDTGRMQTNLDATLGVLHAAALAHTLAGTIGRERAEAAVDSWCRRAVAERQPLRVIASQEIEVLGVSIAAERWDEIFDGKREIEAARARTLEYLAHRSGSSGRPTPLP